MENLGNSIANQGEGAKSEAEKVLGAMPRFEDKDTVSTRINNALEKDNGRGVSFSEDILCRINGAIFGKDRSSIVENGECIGADMTGGASYVAPNKMIRGVVFDLYKKAIDGEEDLDKRAKTAYYATINMHFFEDGNGRTARAMYLIMKNGGLSKADASYLKHGEGKRGSSEFEKQNDIEGTEEINDLALRRTIDKGIQDGEFPKWVGEWVRENGIFSIYAHSEPNQDELERMGLNEDERQVLFDICKDTYLIGYATLKLLVDEGADKSLFEMNTLAPFFDAGGTMIATKRIGFTHSRRNTDRYNSVYGSMTAEKYRKLITIYNDLKIEQNKKVIEMAKDNENSVE